MSAYNMYLTPSGYRELNRSRTRRYVGAIYEVELTRVEAVRDGRGVDQITVAQPADDVLVQVLQQRAGVTG